MGYDKDVLIRSTLARTVRPFLSAPDAKLFDLSTGQPTPVPKRWFGGNSRSEQPRYCPVCALADKQEFGAVFWHTAHQHPNVRACVRHRCRLITVEQVGHAESGIYHPADWVDSDAITSEATANEIQIATRIITDEHLPRRYSIHVRTAQQVYTDARAARMLDRN